MACTSSAPNATSRAASTTSCVAAPAARATPARSRFFVSFEDDLMKRFSPEWVPNLLGRMGMDEDTPLESGMVSKAIEQAQTKVEGYNFDIRKHVVQYDDVMNQHRDVIYKQRRRILGEDNLRASILDMVHREIERAFDAFAYEDNPDQWDMDGLYAELKAMLPLPAAFSSDTSWASRSNRGLTAGSRRSKR